MKTIRKITGIAALVMTILSILCYATLGKDHLFCQIDVWMRYAAFILAIVCFFIWLLNVVKGLHWALRIFVVVVPFSIILFFVVAIVLFTGSLPDSKTWEDGRYVVYHESGHGIEEGKYVMYKRYGMFERHCYPLFADVMNPKSIDYYFYDNLDLIREEAEWSFDGNNWHTTRFYRLSDGFLYEQNENEKIQKLLEKEGFQ